MRLLWVLCHFHSATLRGIRARSLTRQLARDHEVHVLSLDAQQAEADVNPCLHRVEMSGLSSGFLDAQSVAWSALSVRDKLRKIPPKAFHALRRRWVFPDWAVREVPRFDVRMHELSDSMKFDAVVISMPRHGLYPLAPRVRALPGKPLCVLDVGDPLLGNAADVQGMLYRLRIRAFEGRALAGADAVVVTNELTRAHFVGNYGLSPDAIHVIPNGCDPPRAEPSPLRDVSSVGCLELVYAGTFYPGIREPGALYDAVHALDGRVRLTIYGPETAFVADPRVDGVRIRYAGLLDHSAVSAAYEEADALVFCENAYGVQSSGKIYELVSARRPILFIGARPDAPTLAAVGNYPALLPCKSTPEDVRRALKEILSRYPDFDCDYDLTPHLWSTRAASLESVLRKTAREET